MQAATAAFREREATVAETEALSVSNSIETRERRSRDASRKGLTKSMNGRIAFNSRVLVADLPAFTD
ncbi:Uncharacterized protein HZ326_5985 [Fusarium oxysporum f. sp. albedinis]|nr:Uncharacterized protein HZ326_5985 [Fusarium oxysporum f. sp. albedinis]